MGVNKYKKLLVKHDIITKCWALNIVVDQAKCDGCRLCELVCSFRLQGSFNPDKPAIKVFKDEKRGIFFPVLSTKGGLLFDGEGNPIVCDLCDGAPKCVEICPNNAIWVRE